jgi:hypothetical protein
VGFLGDGNQLIVFHHIFRSLPAACLPEPGADLISLPHKNQEPISPPTQPSSRTKGTAISGKKKLYIKTVENSRDQVSSSFYYETFQIFCYVCQFRLDSFSWLFKAMRIWAVLQNFLTYILPPSSGFNLVRYENLGRHATA